MRGKARERRVVSIASTLLAGLIVSAPTQADYLPVYGAPSSYRYAGSYPPLAASGFAVDIGYSGSDTVAFHWDATGTAFQMGNLGLDASGMAYMELFAINSSGVATGDVAKNAAGSNFGSRAVTWSPSGTVTELGNLGTAPDGTTNAVAFAISNNGITAGEEAKYNSGVYKGYRAVRWDANGVATELGNLGLDNNGQTDGTALAVNNSGIGVGTMTKYVNGVSQNDRAVRWDASGNITELGNLGAKPDGSIGQGDNKPVAINDAGTAVGFSAKYILGNRFRRAVRWDASGTAAVQLGDFSGDTDSQFQSSAVAINAAGLVVGNIDLHAIRWNAAGVATMLGVLSTAQNGMSNSNALDINDAGISVGFANLYNGSTDGSQRAVMWEPDGTGIDLNSLIDPTSGWLLINANSITNDGWITGTGFYTPPGSDAFGAYETTFLIHVPEPASIVWLIAIAWPLKRPSRSRVRRDQGDFFTQRNPAKLNH